MKRTIKCAALLLALVLLCAGCGKKQPAQPDQYGLAPEPSKLDGVAIGNDLEIVSTGRYAGLFVEDGSDETVSDVFCIRVKNTGSTGVQYAHITLTRGGECYEFDITTLLPGETVQALELSRQTLPEKPAELTAAVTTYAPFSETPSMHDDVLEVAASQNGITVTNRSDVGHVPGLCLLQKRQRRPAAGRHYLSRRADGPGPRRDPDLLRRALQPGLQPPAFRDLCPVSCTASTA